ncbi:MAG: EAL domain-containing protein [Gammaproteobacteria bacterium]|nr:EAL domain-containing protein [Gammaproteobacteria bacterium]
MTMLRSSMRTSLVLTVLIMGLLGITLAIVTGQAYQRLALENQHDIFTRHATRMVGEIFNEVAENATRLGIRVQNNAGFQQAFLERDKAELIRQLNSHFRHATVVINHFDLAQIYVLDNNHMPVARASVGRQFSIPAPEACPSLLNDTTRPDSEHLSLIAQRCLIDNKPYLGITVPITGVNPKGHLLLIVDPIPSIIQVGASLGAPTRINLPDGQSLLKTDDWPSTLTRKVLVAELQLKTASGGPYIHMAFASNAEDLLSSLAGTRNRIFAIAAVAMLLTALVALLVFQRTTLTPLLALTQQLRYIQKDKAHLGRQIEVRGITEIAELAANFNNMSRELDTLYRTLENMAFTDALTGMANRTLFYDRLEQTLLKAQRDKIEFSLFMMDLNRFKKVNDTLGHHIGDHILQEVGRRLHKVLRKSDTVARLGGDEFAALLPTTEYDEGSIIVAEKVVHSLGQAIQAEGHHLTVGVSIGIVHFPRDGENANLLMRRADVAMYQAKQQGKGFAFYDPSMDSDNLFELTMEAELRAAVKAGAFDLHYQPKIDLKTGKIYGVEALIRWTHPEHGFIAPDKFIPLAEQSGLVKPLTEWVLDNALAQCARWHKQGIKISVAVNLSAHSLNDLGLLNTVRHALGRAKIAPEWLTLELTETTIMSDAVLALNTLTRLDAMGVRLSVDDFGTGYSSLAYLKRLPVDEIKIDKSFVMDMADDASDAVIVRSTIDLAHNMGLSVVAEGIESREIWNQLFELNCNSGQGFYMSRPIPAEELEHWLKESPWGLKTSAG